MSSVGTTLRKSRLEHGFSLEDISARTRILVKNLQAIESDDLSKISSPFLYRSFVRQFAEEVQMDYTSLAAAVLEASGAMPQPRLPGEGGEPCLGLARIPVRRRSEIQWAYPTAALVAVVVVCSGLYAFWLPGTNGLSARVSKLSLVASRFGLNGSKMPSTNTNESSRAQPARSQITPPTPTPAASPQLGTPPAAETDTGIHIRLLALEATWLSIVADGKPTYSGVLKASQTKVLVGRETARIRTGNAGGLTVEFNGKELGPMGRRGETRTLLFTTTGYEVVRSAAQALVPALFTVPAKASIRAVAE